MGKPPEREDLRRAVGETVRSLRHKAGMAQEGSHSKLASTAPI